ncbi:MAG TPA: MamI family restriction endonuclease, partial [Planctomycetaceae bacterium]|nr:MamI family restriction endonuclease [Planctomycetaceae bacterium]
MTKPFADKTFHPVPCDTRSWSQILVSILTGINGREREKGSDLVDGSDVKAANCWSAIDTPRFNGAIPAGRLSKTSRKAEDVTALDDTPFI